MSGTSTKDGGFGGGAFGVHLLAVMTEEKEPGRAAADDGEHADRGDDQLEFALWRGGAASAAPPSACSLSAIARPPGSRNELVAARQALKTRYKCRRRTRALLMRTLR